MKRSLKNMILNFGPQHPAAHGVLRVLLDIKGEVINRVDSHIGLLHRGTEKLIEYKTYMQALPYFDRLDYVSMMAQEYCYSVCVEMLMKYRVNFDVWCIRFIFFELTRILNHLLALTTHALDVGALTPFLWGFEVREYLMEFYERVCGARLHSAFIRPGGLSRKVSRYFLVDLYKFFSYMCYRVDEMDDLLSNNRIWRHRLEDIGVINYKDVFSLGLSGVLARGSGLVFDERLFDLSLNNFSLFDFKVYLGICGDSYDRYLIRVNEMRESINIVLQLLNVLLNKEVNIKEYGKIKNPSNIFFKSNMEKLIHHFKLFTEGFSIKQEDCYYSVEAPKGIFSVYLKSDNTNIPYRCRIKAPGFLSLQSLSYMVEGLLLSDMVTVIGTQDLVFGEVDR